MRNRGFKCLFPAVALAVLGGAGIGLASPPPPPPDPGCTGPVNVCHGTGKCSGSVNICPNSDECESALVNVCKGIEFEDR